MNCCSGCSGAAFRGFIPIRSELAKRPKRATA
jgi:hypothetical protein